jgi:hypothetical protein
MGHTVNMKYSSFVRHAAQPNPSAMPPKDEEHARIYYISMRSVAFWAPNGLERPGGLPFLHTVNRKYRLSAQWSSQRAPRAA